MKTKEEEETKRTMTFDEKIMYRFLLCANRR